MNWTPIEELKDKYETRLLLCAPELVDLDCNPDGIGMGYWQDDGLLHGLSIEECAKRDEMVDYGCFLAGKWSMQNDEWNEVACNPTHFIVMVGPKKPSRLYGEVEDAEANLQNVRDDYLRRWGWQHTCNNAGFLLDVGA